MKAEKEKFESENKLLKESKSLVNLKKLDTKIKKVESVDSREKVKTLMEIIDISQNPDHN